MSTGNKVKLVSSDKQVFEVDELVAYESKTLRFMIEEAYESPYLLMAHGQIPLPNVSGKILSKIIVYCEYHLQAQKLSAEEKPVQIQWGSANFSNIQQAKLDEIREWDANFITVDQYTLYDLMDAANYLFINPLMILTCQTFADIIRLYSPEEVRTLFGIENDLTPQEEEEIKNDVQWAFSWSLITWWD